MFHVYMECSRLQSLFKNLKGLLLKIWIHFSPTLLIFGHPVQRGEGREGGGGLPVGLLLGLAKMAIHGFRQRAVEGRTAVGCLPLFRGYVCARMSLQRDYAVSTGTLEAFRERWSPWEVDCIVDKNVNSLISLLC